MQHSACGHGPERSCCPADRLSPEAFLMPADGIYAATSRVRACASGSMAFRMTRVLQNAQQGPDLRLDMPWAYLIREDAEAGGHRRCTVQLRMG
jgi:hypothetical protein